MRHLVSAGHDRHLSQPDCKQQISQLYRCRHCRLGGLPCREPLIARDDDAPGVREAFVVCGLPGGDHGAAGLVAANNLA